MSDGGGSLTVAWILALGSLGILAGVIIAGLLGLREKRREHARILAWLSDLDNHPDPEAQRLAGMVRRALLRGGP